MFEISRQSIYQKEYHIYFQNQKLKLVKEAVMEIRMQMSKIVTRKLYFLLDNKFLKMSIKIGRDAFFDFLKSDNMLIKPMKNYTKTTNSKHWLRMHPNLFLGLVVKEPDQVYVSDITYIKNQEKLIIYPWLLMLIVEKLWDITKVMI